MDDKAIGLLCIGLGLLLGLMGSKRRKRLRGGLLEAVLLTWTPRDPFRVRDLLNGGVLVTGRCGSGKTSTSGRMLMQAIVDHPRSGGLVLCAKPDDAANVRRIFAKAGRLKDLIVFNSESRYRFSFMDYLRGQDTRNLVECLMAVAEVLRRNSRKSGGENAAFWEASQERLLMAAVGMLQLAGEPITAANLHRFISSAASSPAELGTPEFKSSYHGKVSERAWNAKKDRIAAGDHQLFSDYWVSDHPRQDPKTRSNVLMGVMSVLSVFASGIVREMVSGETNVSPDDILRGKWVVVDFPPSSKGVAGSFICAGWKYLTQHAILKRHVNAASPFVTIWADEAHLFVNGPDQAFIAMCRSHRGCLVYLSQSVSSFYAAMGGGSDHDEADALLANFSHVIIHASDPVTAKWAASKLGRERETMLSGGSGSRRDEDVFDELMGRSSAYQFSFSESYEQVLQDQEFMVGRTGGPQNGFVADAIVIKSGETFSSGAAYERVTFSQK